MQVAIAGSVRRANQAVAEANVAFPLGTVLLEHVQMVSATWSAANKVVPARNAVFPAILIPESYQERHERVAIFKGLNRNGDIQDRLGEDPGNGRATDMLDVDGRSDLPPLAVPVITDKVRG